MAHTDESNTGSSAQVKEGPFGNLSIDIESSMTREDRYRFWFDRHLAAPIRIIWNDWRARIGTILVFTYLFMGTIGVVVTEAPYANMGPTGLSWFDSSYVQQPLGVAPVTIGFLDWTYTGVWAYPLGTDGLGQDLVSATIHATPPMLQMILSGAVFAMFMGIVLGVTAGYKGGVVDKVFMTIVDVVMTLPGLPLLIVIAAVIEPKSPFLVGLILGIDNWPGLARQLRSQVLTLRDEEYVESSRLMGMSTTSIMRTDVVPNIMPFVLIRFVGASRWIVFESVGLYFLGVLPISQGNWGVALDRAIKSQAGFYGLGGINRFIVPMVAIVGLTLGLTLLSQSFDKVFNPRIRARNSKSVAGSERPDQEK